MQIISKVINLKKSKVAFLTTIFPNKDEYLDNFFDSLKNQTFKDFDVIVVNDNYEDFDNIRKKYKQYLNLIEIKYSNTPAKNREQGINFCIDSNYEILIFGDSDDYFGYNRVEKSIELLKNNEIVFNDLNLFNNDGVYEKKYISNRLNNYDVIDFEFIKDKNVLGMSNTAVKLKNISKVAFDPKLIAVDWFFFKNLLSKGLKAIFTNETVSYYRQYRKNLVGLNKEGDMYYLWWEKKNN